MQKGQRTRDALGDVQDPCVGQRSGLIEQQTLSSVRDDAHQLPTLPKYVDWRRDSRMPQVPLRKGHVRIELLGLPSCRQQKARALLPITSSTAREVEHAAFRQTHQSLNDVIVANR